MSSVDTRTRRRRRSPWRAVVAGLLAVALVGGVVGAAVIAVGGARDQGYLGGPIVVPAEYRKVIKAAAKRCPQVPVEVFAAQLAAESSWDTQARSPAGARGIAQFMPEVWEQYGIDADRDGTADVWNPVDAIHSAAELNCLNRRLVRGAGGDRLENTLAAYNAGFNAVLRHDGIPPYPETEAYVAKILDTARTIRLS